MIDAHAPLSADFLITALIVVLAPGTGVVYTLSSGAFQGARASILAAAGCTLGIVPHLLAGVLGLAALLHASAVAFQAVKLAGVAYLLYLAWEMWRGAGPLRLDPSRRATPTRARTVVVRGVLINILNPKLSVFFLAFLPQFVPESGPDTLSRMALLGGVFMAMTFVVFVGYGLTAAVFGGRMRGSDRAVLWVRRLFAAAFAGFAAKLLLANR